MRLGFAYHCPCLVGVSIHASVKDATSVLKLLLFLLLSFNPRICKRCDLFALISMCGCKQVSIHASVKDATKKEEAIRVNAEVSIHASVKDATCAHTFRRTTISSFNPRICKRCDEDCGIIVFRTKVSIHASVKDATLAGA